MTIWSEKRMMAVILLRKVNMSINLLITIKYFNTFHMNWFWCCLIFQSIQGILLLTMALEVETEKWNLESCLEAFDVLFCSPVHSEVSSANAPESPRKRLVKRRYQLPIAKNISSQGAIGRSIGLSGGRDQSDLRTQGCCCCCGWRDLLVVRFIIISPDRREEAQSTGGYP